jgi:hypothetical protein|tara:strand:- start:459 stop:578 length:120 start_codon:yes stop_codon:yes gene_type:complete
MHTLRVGAGAMGVPYGIVYVECDRLGFSKGVNHIEHVSL